MARVGFDGEAAPTFHSDPLHLCLLPAQNGLGDGVHLTVMSRRSRKVKFVRRFALELE